MVIDKISLLYNYKGYIVDEIPSTNSFLKNEYDKYPDKTVLIAKIQTNGRGRYNRVWQSNGDITFSILYKNNNDYNIITPLAIVLALKEFRINAGIKWPNDIYLDGKKLAGILIEEIYLDSFKAAIVGIGLNRYNKPDLNAIGFSNIIDVDNQMIINRILYYMDKLSLLPFNNLVSYYKEFSVILNRIVSYKFKDYKAIDITKEGHLLLQNETETISVSCDEINIKEALK